MTFKKGTWGETAKYWLLHPIAISCYAALGIILLLVFLIRIWLGFYTNHGDEFELPDLTGMTVEQANAKLEENGLSYTIVDSMYSATVPAGCVIDQVPNAGDKVKTGRCIYLYVRAKNPRQISMPDYNDKSLRQYQGELETAGLKVKEIKFVPSKYNTVIGVEYCGKTIYKGYKLIEGSGVTLKVGKGESNDMTSMPSLHGLNLPDATQRVQAMALNVNVVFDVHPSSEDNKRFYKVWSQKPITNTKLKGTETVTLYVTTDVNKLAQPEEVAKSKDDEGSNSEPTATEE